jgi:hypothetical protein
MACPEPHVAVKKLFDCVMSIVEDAVVPEIDVYVMVRLADVGTVRTPFESRNSTVNSTVLPQVMLYGIAITS